MLEKKVDVELAKVFLKQTADALVLLHSNRIIHRDIKPENLLLSRDSQGQMVVKLADFGISKLSSKAGSTMKGTPNYMAPEILNGVEVYTNKVDMWSLGCSYYEMISGIKLSKSRKTNVILEDIRTFPSRKPENLDAFSQSILTGLLENNPDQRITAQEVLERCRPDTDQLDADFLAQSLYERIIFFNDLKSWEELKVQAEKGNSLAAAFTMIVYSRGSNFNLIPVDKVSANKISTTVTPKLEKEAKLNSPFTLPRTLYILGVVHEDGLAVSQDYQKAIEWYSTSANLGHAIAQSVIGFLYEKGGIFPADYTKAIEWYSKATEKGLAYAQNNLADLYHKGLGVTVDHEKAIELYSLAAAQGYAPAQINLGIMHENGLGVPANHEIAKEWYSKAAQQGYTKA